MANQESDKNILNIVKSNWIFVIFCASVLVAWTSLKIQTEANTKSIFSIGERIEKNESINDSNNIKLSSQLSQIQTDLLWIRERLKIIK